MITTFNKNEWNTSAQPDDLLESLQCHFKYDTETGELYSRYRNKMITSQQVSHRGTTYRTAQICYALGRGTFPTQPILCKDGNKYNWKLQNLEASHIYEKRSPQKSALGMKGVAFQHGKYTSRVYHNGKCYYCGIFDNAEDASRARIAKLVEVTRNEPPKPRKPRTTTTAPATAHTTTNEPRTTAPATTNEPQTTTQTEKPLHIPAGWRVI